MLPRTDLAMEAKELFERSAGEQTRLSGVLARETDRRGVRKIGRASCRERV